MDAKVKHRLATGFLGWKASFTESGVKVFEVPLRTSSCRTTAISRIKSEDWDPLTSSKDLSYVVSKISETLGPIHIASFLDLEENSVSYKWEFEVRVDVEGVLIFGRGSTIAEAMVNLALKYWDSLRTTPS